MNIFSLPLKLLHYIYRLFIDYKQAGSAIQSIYDCFILDTFNRSIPLSTFRGNVLLIVNVASFCGYTKQYKELEILYKKYHSYGLEILAFPSNDFWQEYDTYTDIQAFCTKNYHITFPLMQPIHVTGPNIDSLYHFLITKTSPIFWNFTKFLINRDATVIKRYSPKQSLALLSSIEQDIQKMLDT